MKSADLHRLEDLYTAAMELPAPERAVYVAAACAEDPDLRRRLERMVADAGEAAEFMETPVLPPAAAEAPGGNDPLIGSHVGRYLLLRVIGVGGMGVVYEAQQDSPSRRVALKLLRPGWVSRSLLRRFEHEAEVLGRLSHPGIAQIHEAGSVEIRGVPQPFFAMELVDGRPITRYAAEQNLSARQRQELMTRVCEAVEHAHQKGVIHRDLKPGNILVDNSGQPKVLDFGVARATDADIAATTLRTHAGQIVGTIAYMSPEQARGNAADLDTRSDVYSLGVLLFELLAGRLPHDIADKSIPEAVRAITEDDPSHLSTIDRSLRGDVETIVAKALERDKDRRYQSAADLAADLRRHLSDEPITARPASTFYQLSKFARRNRALVAGVVVTCMALSAGMVGTSLFLVRALRAEGEAKSNLADARTARTTADEERKRANENASHLATELSASSIERGRLLGASGAMASAEDLIWPELLRHPDSLHARHALRELYARHPAVRTFRGHSGPVGGLAFSPDGRAIASASRDATVKLWNSASGRCVATLLGHSGEVNAVRFSPDGTLLASAGMDGTLRVWDAQSGACRASIKAHRKVLDLGFSPDGSLLASCGSDALIHVWAIPSWTRLVTLRGHAGPVESLAFGPDGASLASGGDDGTVRLWNPTTGERIGLPLNQESRVMTVAFRPTDSDVLACSTFGGAVKLWDLRERRCVVSLTLSGEKEYISFSPDGRTLVSTGIWKTELWDVGPFPQPAPTLRTTIGSGGRGAAFSPDGSTMVATTSRSDNEFVLWEVGPEQHAKVLLGPGGKQALSFSPTGQRLTVRNRDRAFRVWELGNTNTAPIAVHRLGEEPRPLCTNRDGTILAWALGSGAIALTDAEMAAPMISLEGHRAPPTVAEFTPDGLTLVSWASDGDLRTWDVATARCVSVHPTGQSEVVDLRMSDDGRTLAASFQPRTILLWDMPSGEPRGAIDAAGVWCIAISPDGRTVACSTFDLTIELWDTASRTRTLSFPAHRGLIGSLDFSPGGRLLATGARDERVRLWEVATGHELAALTPASAGEDDLPSYAVAFGPTDDVLAAGGADGAITIWNLADHDRHIAVAMSSYLVRFGPMLDTPINIEALAVLTGEGSRGASRLHATIAQGFIAKGRPDDAVDAYRLAARADPHDSSVRCQLGVLLAEAGRHTEAIIEFRVAALINPTLDCRSDTRPLQHFVESLRTVGAGAEARALLDRALSDSALLGADGLWDSWVWLALSESRPDPVALLAALPGPVQGLQSTYPPQTRRDDFAWLLSTLASRQDIRIRCGPDEDYTTPSGIFWSRDRFFVGGQRYGQTFDAPLTPRASIAGTDSGGAADATVYQSGRSWPGAPDLADGYRIPVPPGRYRVTLHFAEIFYRKPGVRTFHVRIEDQQVLTAYEPRAAGFATANRAVVETTVNDGLLNVEFVHVTNDPKVSGIEVHALGER